MHATWMARTVLRLAVAALAGARASAGNARFLPGAQRGAWPYFLFQSRATLGDFRLAEISAAADTLGFSASLAIEPDVCGAPSGEGAAARQRVYTSEGGDVGPGIFQWVALPDAAAAAAVADRCVLVRGAFEVWASCSGFDDSAPPKRDEALSRWEVLANAVQGDGECASEARRRVLQALGSGSWRVDVETFGAHKPRTLAGKIELMELLDALLQEADGEVELKKPDHVIVMLEDVSRSGEKAYGEEGEVAEVEAALLPRPPRRLFLGRRLSGGGAGRLATFALSRRPYLGRTTLPPEMAFLMATQSRCAAGALVLDPFCGTASTLLSCAAHGARTVGVELDARVLYGGEADCGENGAPASPRGIMRNFDAARVTRPEVLACGDAAEVLASGELSGSAGATYERFDAIVTDPPYGLMEGLGGAYLPLAQRLDQLLGFASRRLRLGGRLVFLLPLPHDAQPSELTVLHNSPCLELEQISRQNVSARMHRLLCTMRKVAEPANAEDMRVFRDPGGAPVAPWERWWEDQDSGS